MTEKSSIEERDANMLYFIPNSGHLVLREMPDVALKVRQAR